MKAFHNDPAIKDKYIARVKAHVLADEIIKGIYWENGKGCAVGCTIHSSSHISYEAELGIPEWLALVEDTIFEGLPNDRAKVWPQEFLEAIQVGKDTNTIKAPFIVFLLQSGLNNFNHEKYPDIKNSVNACIELYRVDEPLDSLKWSAAESAAWGAAWSAASAAERAARSAASAASAARAAERAEYVKFADKLLDLLRAI